MSGPGTRGRRLRIRGLGGWGAVAATAAVGALALASAALPELPAPPRVPATASAEADGAEAASAEADGAQTNGGPGHRVNGPAAPASGPAEQRTSRSPAARADDDGCDPTRSLRPSGASGAAVRRIKARGRLIAGVDQNSYLWGYRDPATRRIVGFDIDLVRAIADDILGDPDAVTYKTVPTDQRIPAIQGGDVDLVVRTMTITCERRREVAFSTVYFEAGQQLLVPRSSPIDAFGDELRGKRVCTAATSTGEATLREDSHGARIVTVPNQLDCLVRLQLGEVDAVLTDSALAAGQAAQDPAVHLVGRQLTREPYGVAMNKRDSDLVRRVNKVLEDYRSGGSASPWMRSFETWLADDMERPPSPPEARYQD